MIKMSVRKKNYMHGKQVKHNKELGKKRMLEIKEVEKIEKNMQNDRYDNTGHENTHRKKNEKIKSSKLVNKKNKMTVKTQQNYVEMNQVHGEGKSNGDENKQREGQINEESMKNENNQVKWEIRKLRQG